jgi:hypothetical protein
MLTSLHSVLVRREYFSGCFSLHFLHTRTSNTCGSAMDSETCFLSSPRFCDSLSKARDANLQELVVYL